jgi:acetyl-CoA carboxylase carboxyl transferase subunit beta
MGHAIEYELAMLSSSGISELLPRRLEKYRNLGGLVRQIPDDRPPQSA